jgi:dimethylamine monooxygenase subunit A
MALAEKMDWQRLFPQADHRFQMLLRPGDARDFWGRQDGTGRLLAERERWLAENGERYVAVRAGAEGALREALFFLGNAAGVVGGFAEVGQAARAVEADWVVLAGELGAGYPIVGGAVVFPSSWSLTEKLGRPLAEVHGPVPGLQAGLGASISTFLDRLVVGASWERLNWGLSGNEELNHHPARYLPGLTEEVRLERCWLRLERQFLTRLGGSGAVLFGIRVSVHRLDELVVVPGVAVGLVRALRSMTAEVAEYKGLTAARGVLCRLLGEVGDGGG